MCRTVHALLSTAICGLQMVMRIIMTTLLMIENIIRMVLQTSYNFISFMMQLVSLVPLCLVFLVSTRLKCLMCGSGSLWGVHRGGTCDCLMSVFAIIILFFIFRATGVLDKIFYAIGYAKATTKIVTFIPVTGYITECSRNDTDTEYELYELSTTETQHYFLVDGEDEILTNFDSSPNEPERRHGSIDEKGDFSVEKIKTDMKATESMDPQGFYTKFINDSHLIYYYS